MVRKGYLYLEDGSGNKNLFFLRDASPNGEGLFVFFVPLMWDKEKHIENPIFRSVMWFPADTDLNTFRLYLPLEAYCSLVKKLGGCDIECLTLREKPIPIRQAFATIVPKSSGSLSGVVRLATRKTVNPLGWEIVNLSKGRKLTFRDAPKLYDLLHFEKGEWKYDTLKVEKVK